MDDSGDTPFDGTALPAWAGRDPDGRVAGLVHEGEARLLALLVETMERAEDSAPLDIPLRDHAIAVGATPTLATIVALLLDHPDVMHPILERWITGQEQPTCEG